MDGTLEENIISREDIDAQEVYAILDNNSFPETIGKYLYNGLQGIGMESIIEGFPAVPMSADQQYQAQKRLLTIVRRFMFRRTGDATWVNPDEQMTGAESKILRNFVKENLPTIKKILKFDYHSPEYTENDFKFLKDFLLSFTFDNGGYVDGRDFNDSLVGSDGLPIDTSINRLQGSSNWRASYEEARVKAAQLIDTIIH